MSRSSIEASILRRCRFRWRRHIEREHVHGHDRHCFANNARATRVPNTLAMMLALISLRLVQFCSIFVPKLLVELGSGAASAQRVDASAIHVGAQSW